MPWRGRREGEGPWPVEENWGRGTQDHQEGRLWKAGRIDSLLKPWKKSFLSLYEAPLILEIGSHGRLLISWPSAGGARLLCSLLARGPKTLG